MNFDHFWCLACFYSIQKKLLKFLTNLEELVIPYQDMKRWRSEGCKTISGASSCPNLQSPDPLSGQLEWAIAIKLWDSWRTFSTTHFGVYLLLQFICPTDKLSGHVSLAICHMLFWVGGKPPIFLWIFILLRKCARAFYECTFCARY